MRHFIINIILVILLFVGITFVIAAPFDTDFVEWTQPNGVKFIARFWGDEFQYWFETQSGHRIIQGTDKWYYYATLNSDGEYAATTSRVGIDLPPSSSYKLERSAARIAEINNQIAEFQEQLRRNAEWFAQKQAIAKAQGVPVVLRLGVILVEFQDVRHYDPDEYPRIGGYLKADFDSMLFSSSGFWFDTTTVDGTPHPENEKIFGSFRDYWHQMSRGQLIIQGTFINPTQANGVPRWILLDNNKSYYHGLTYLLRNEAYAKAIDSNRLNPSIWTVNPAGFDKYIYIFAGHQPRYVPMTHGGDGTFIQCPERWGRRLSSPDNIAFGHIGVYAHEFGHNLGFQDEYVGTAPGVGNTDLYVFDLMAWGIYNGPNQKGECPATLSPYYRIDKGWISSIPLTSDTTNFRVEYNYENPNVYRIDPGGAAPNEHYLFETRLRQGFDSYIPTSPDSFIYQPGTLLVWHHNIEGECGYIDWVRLKHADNTRAWGSFLTDLFPSNAATNRQSLNDITTPAATVGSSNYPMPGDPECNNERPAHFALNGIHRVRTSVQGDSDYTVIDTIALRHSMVSTRVTSGWHMLGVPANVPNFSVSAVYPTATSPALAWLPDSGYVVRTMLELGKGYFIRFGATQNIVLAGGLVDSLPIAVNAQWNLLGSISDRIPTSNVCVYPYPSNRITSLVFNYVSGRGYVPVDSIKPGLAHWVKVQQAGTLVMKRFPSSCRPVRTIELAELDHFEITDANGGKQDVYVANIDRDPSLDEIDLSMPPPFPEAEFDARFATGEYVKTVSAENGIVELILTVETRAYPVTITWELNPENGIEYSIITEGVGKQQASNRLAQSGSAVMTTAAGGKFRMNAQATGQVTTGNLPTEYSLVQNYPNPFNPSTVIRYQLPVTSYATLKVYNVLGQEVASLVNEVKQAGTYEVAFDGTHLPSGVYFYRMAAGNFSSTKKLLLIK